MIRTRAAVAMVACVTLAAIAMRVVLPHAPLGVRLQLSQPFAVLTGAGIFGAMQMSVLAIGLTVATAAYFMLMRELSKREALDSRAIRLAASAAIGVVAACWLVPVAFSSDVYAYAAYGQAALRGADPFARLVLSGSDQLTAAARIQWGAAVPACVYGWGFVATAAAVMWLTVPMGLLAQLDGLRLTSSVAALACGALAYAAFPGDRTTRLRSAVLIGCNPVTLWCAAEGHNDAWAAAVGLAGCALARGRPRLGAFVAGAAGAFKLPAIAAGAFVTFRRPDVWIAALAGVTVSAAAMWPVATHWASGSNVHGGYAPQASLQGLTFVLLAPVAGYAAARMAAIVLASCAAIALGAVGGAHLRRSERDGWVLLALAAWLLIPNPYPWYGLWLTLAAALAPASRAATVIVWTIAGSLVRYVPDAAGIPPLLISAMLSAIAIIPYALLIRARRSAIINGPT
ncbi:MAG: hypothetical protein ABI431_09720 [Candidatus Tumulicola sp.]